MAGSKRGWLGAAPRATHTWPAALWFLVLVLLAGCALAGLSGLARPGAGPAVLHAGTPGGLAPGTVIPAGRGLVAIVVKWPVRKAQFIPDSTSRVLFEVSREGAQVAATAISRPAGSSTSEASLERDAGSYRLAATAQGGAALVAVATASAALTVVAGARTQVALTLGATFLPAVSGRSQVQGLVGESVTFTGTDLVLSWAATPSVRFSGESASVSAIVTALGTDAVTATVPRARSAGRCRSPWTG